MYYIKQELGSAKTYAHSLLDERSDIDRHWPHMFAKLGVTAFVDENQDRCPKWNPKLHKRPCNSRFIADSRSYIAIELFILLTSCFTSIKSILVL